ncbi:hypothetical protein SNE40_016158 [Patella caerulea]|uniref:Folate receptor-like domain-containing protein n=1 Tax=Patella caerulea TaxID=87958 RepID=A0AAN8J8T7_PATCE
MWRLVEGILVLCFISDVFCVERNTYDDLINTCLDGRHHKSKPGPESNLFNFCKPWKDRSCCTNQTSEDLHNTDAWLNFDWNHCQQLSPKCREHFMQDLCFYECSPNVGPWLVPVKMKIRNEKFIHVPLCETDCTNWWNDCKDEMTCLQNWGKDFNWTTGQNTCPVGKPCKKFSEIYSNSSNFCETIWNFSWKVVPETEQCMHLWFTESDGNPNDEVAQAKAKEILANHANNVFSKYFQFYYLFLVLFCFFVI